MKKYIDFIYKTKKGLQLFLFLSIIVSLYGIFQIRLNSDFSIFSTNDSSYETTLNQMTLDFGSLHQLSILVETDTFDTQFQQTLYTLQRDLESLSFSDYLEGAAPEVILVGQTPTPYMDLSPTQILAYYANFEEFSPITIKDSKTYFTFTLMLTDTFSRTDLHSLENILNSTNTTYYISGDDYSQIKITDYIFQILLILPPLAMLTIFFIFKSQMKNLKATIFSVLPAGVGSLWTLGIVGLSGNQVSILTAIVPIFIIVIGSADGLHFVSHYQELKESGLNSKEALTKTLNMVGVPMIITTLTSIAGFISLLSMNTSSVIDLAIYSSIGILLAGVATWLVLPLILSSNIVIAKKGRKVHHKPHEYLKKVWGLPSIITVLLILSTSLIFMGSINNEFNMLLIYKDYTEVSKSASKIADINGGSVPLFVYIELDESPITLASKTYVDEISDLLNASGDTTKIVNPYHMLDILYNLSQTGSIDSDSKVQLLYQTISASNSGVLDHFIQTDDNTVRLLVFSKDLNNSTLLNIESLLTGYTNVKVTGVQYMLMDLNQSINAMQLNSILFALLFVFLLMFISLRNFKLALLSILPIAITIITLYGFLGLTQIPLNITTVMIFSITIGVGIDYAIHYTSTYQYFLKEGHLSKEATDMSYSFSSRPIITNALGISLGLTIMMLSPLTIHFNVSVLMWVSMVMSVFVTLTLLPTIFRKLK